MKPKQAMLQKIGKKGFLNMQTHQHSNVPKWNVAIFCKQISLLIRLVL